MICLRGENVNSSNKVWQKLITSLFFLRSSHVEMFIRSGSTYLTLCLSIVSLSIASSFQRPKSSSQVEEILSRCEREGKELCEVPAIPNENEINKAIKSSLYLKSHFLESDEFWHQRRLIRRAKRESVAELCTATQDSSEPFSFVRNTDGWSQVATTTQFPQRVIFAIEKCTRPNAPCRGVQSPLPYAKPICYQEFARHTILTFNDTTKNIAPRYITLPFSCKCKLEVKSPTESAGVMLGWSEPEPRGKENPFG